MSIPMQEQAIGAFKNIYGRQPSRGRDDQWAAFREGWNRCATLAISECVTFERTKTGPGAYQMRRMARQLAALMASLKALETEVKEPQ